jgi:putative transposase
MIYATTPEEIAVSRRAFIRNWRLEHRAVADSLEEEGDRLFTFVRLSPSQWRCVRTTNAIERLHEESTPDPNRAVLPSADTAAMSFWAPLASGQNSMRKVDGWRVLTTKPLRFLLCQNSVISTDRKRAHTTIPNVCSEIAVPSFSLFVPAA